MFYLTSITFGIALLHLVRSRLESIKICNPKLARLWCKIIPARCPFDRELKLFNHTVGTHSTSVQAEPSLRASG